MLTVIIIDPFAAFVNILQKTFLNFAKKHMVCKESSSLFVHFAHRKKDLIFRAECDIILWKKAKEEWP